MAESLKSGSTGAKEKVLDQKELLKEEKKKVKVLKGALKEGRKAQESAEAELNEAKLKIEKMSVQAQDRVSRI